MNRTEHTGELDTEQIKQTNKQTNEWKSRRQIHSRIIRQNI